MTRRGAVLFEVMLSVALFVGAAAFALAAVRSVFTTLDQSSLRQQAVDLARSKLAELEAGLISITDLRGDAGEAVGSFDFSELETAGDLTAGSQSRWVFDVKTHPTEFRGLTLVELTVREERESEGQEETLRDQGAAPMTYTLRQLIALRETDAPAYEADELLEGLPAEGGGER